jgi:hypothetical protein
MGRYLSKAQQLTGDSITSFPIKKKQAAYAVRVYETAGG